MNWYEIFYWLTVADGVKTFFDVASDIATWMLVISLVFYVIMWGVSLDTDEWERNENGVLEPTKTTLNLRKLSGFMFWGFTIISLITWFGYVATPTKKDALMIIAGGGTMQYLTTDSVGKQIPKEVSTFLVTELKQMSKEAQVELGIASEKDKILEKAKTMTSEELMNTMKVDSKFRKIILEK
jgi:hypothetical protein